MKEINSRHNEHIKMLYSLHTPKGRAQQQLFLIEGRRVVREFLSSSSYEIIELVTTHEQIPFVQQNAPRHAHTVVSQEVMQKISQAATPSGIVAVCKLPDIPLKKIEKPGIVLAQIQDPGNMGTFIRTAVACNVPSIVIVDSTDPWSYKCIQATAGMLAHADLRCMTWEELLMHKKASLHLYAFVVRDGKHPQSLPLKEHLLVIGNEAHGLPRAWQDACQERITLPMPGNSESLNAAIAGSIALYIAYVL